MIRTNSTLVVFTVISAMLVGCSRSENQDLATLRAQVEAADARIAKLEAAIIASKSPQSQPGPNESESVLRPQLNAADARIDRLETFFAGIVNQSKSEVFKPIKPVTLNPTERSLVGVWELTKGDKGDIKEMSFECTEQKTMKVSGKGRHDMFTIEGTFAVEENEFVITLTVPGVDPITSRGKIKKLTATELILEDEKGKVEEYKRVTP